MMNSTCEQSEEITIDTSCSFRIGYKHLYIFVQETNVFAAVAVLALGL